MSDLTRLERHATRLVRCYPRLWRERYADEFTQLLVDETRLERRTLWTALYRDGNVVLHGLWTRLAYCGLTGAVADPHRRRRAELIVLSGVVTAFAMLAAGIWSQLTVGWAWSAPADAVTRVGITVMSAAIFGMAAVLFIFGLAAVGWLLLQLRHRRGPRQRSLWLICLLAAALLWWGSDHFAAHWPGTGGQPWPGRGLIPASLARVAWAATLWITSYWAHPAALATFPAGEVAWMLASPVAWLVLLVCAAALMREVRVTRAVAHAAALAASILLGLMTTFMVGATMWVSSAAFGPRNLFAVGTIDLGILVVLAAGLTVATPLVRRLLAGAPDPAASAP